jgi:hypothetical protein
MREIEGLDFNWKREKKKNMQKVRHHQYHPLKTEDFKELGIETMKLQQCQSRRQLNRKFESFF